MRSPFAALSTAVATGALVATGAVLAAPASADTVRFSPGEGTSVSDGRIVCVMGVSDAGVGSVRCSGTQVSRLWEARTRCTYIDAGVTKRGDGMRAIGLKERGRTGKEEICGVGGAKNAERGDSIVLAGIRGKRLEQGGFTFKNRSGHGFTLTARTLRRF